MSEKGGSERGEKEKSMKRWRKMRPRRHVRKESFRER